MRIEKFLSLYSKETTRRVYRAGIYDFLDHIYGRVRQNKRVTPAEKEKYEKLADRYFMELEEGKRDAFEDLLSFVASMNGAPPTGAKAKIAGVKEWLSHYGIELSQRQIKQLRGKMPKGKMSRTAEKDIDKEILRKILTHADLKLKALTLVLASSGMRIGEALQIRLDDVDLSTAPAQIVIRGGYSKSGDTRTTFLSSEAKEVLEEWLSLRDRYLKEAANKNRGLVRNGRAKPKQAEDNRLFPYTDKTVREMWESALRRAGLFTKDTSTNRSQIRIHGLRKFFRSQLALGCPVDVVEALMGHEGYLTEAYRRYTIKQLGEYYLKGEHHLTIFESGDLREIKEKQRDMEATIEGYKLQLMEKDREVMEMRRELETMRQRLDAIDEILKLLVDDKSIIDRLKKKIS